MISEEIDSELLDQLPTLKKALANEEKRTEELIIAKDELNTTKDELNTAKDEIKELKQKLKDNNIEVD